MGSNPILSAKKASKLKGFWLFSIKGQSFRENRVFSWKELAFL